jgi:predicted nucleic acid-binding protein
VRLIVADTSVLVAAFFPETMTFGDGGVFDLSARAKPVADLIRAGLVRCYSPDLLLVEFLATAAKKAIDRQSSAKFDVEEVRSLVNDFLTLPLAPVDGSTIAPIAADLVLTERVSPPDSWFVAAAIHTNAELWYSHRHRDGIVEAAERLHANQVFTLTEHKFI